MSLVLEFIGAAGTVTGSRHLLHTHSSDVLLDCGFYQGRRAESRERNQHLGFEPSTIDSVVLSHAHIDHSGALPLLVKNGYRGPIYATPATRDLCGVMLHDAAMIQAADARYLNRAIALGRAEGDPISPLYDKADVERCLGQMVTLPYHRPKSIAPDVRLTYLDAGHVLGSAVVVLDVDDVGSARRVAFTGDLGRSHMPILRDPEVPQGVEVLVMESTYGDRVHPPIEEMDDELAEVILRTHARGGKVVIPSFALERAQEILFSLRGLRRRGRIPKIAVFVDSPLTVNVTEVFRRHPECFDKEAQRMLQTGETAFDFDGLRYVSSVEDSMAIQRMTEPCVIISASGMCEGGRVLHHLKATIEDARNTVLIVGFQAQHTLGRRIVERRSRLRIFGVERNRHAEVVTLNGFSAHADQRDLLAFAEAVRERGPLRHVVLVHGEEESQRTLKELLSQRGFPSVFVPKAGQLLTV